MDAGLTLEKAKTLVQQCKAVQEQQILLKQVDKEDKSITFLQHPKVRNRSQAPAQKARTYAFEVFSMWQRDTHSSSAHPEVLSVTTAKRRGTTVHNIFTRPLQRSPYPQSRM